MAKSKQVTESTLDAETQKLLDAARAGEKVTEADVTALVGLTPIYAAEEALAQKWPPIVGYVDRIERLPVQREGKNDEYTPTMIRVVLTQPTKGISGPKDARKISDVAAGEDILLPVSGSLMVNSKLERAAADPVKAHKMIIMVTGTSSTGKASDMWNFHIEEITAQSISRAGHPKLGYPLAFASFSGTQVEGAPALPQPAPASNGAVQTS